MLAAGKGTAKMQEIGRAVQEGAAPTSNRQFRTLGVFVVVVFVLLFAAARRRPRRADRPVDLLPRRRGVLGLDRLPRHVAGDPRATSASPRPPARTAAGRRPCRSRSAPAASSACSPSASACSAPRSSCWSTRATRPKVLEGFGFGAALLAMFMRVGGGIFTKAADVGADLVGKVEQGIPEDDPRNAATIADNVGDNVGDCAGMAADLFESYAVTLVAALILGTAAFGAAGPGLPADRARRSACSPRSSASTSPGPRRRARPDRDQPRLLHLRGDLRGAVRGRRVRLPARAPSPTLRDPTDARSSRRMATATRGSSPSVAVIIGIVLAGVILLAHRLLHRHRDKPVKDVAKSSLTGAATVILSGISIGFESAVYTALRHRRRGVRRVPARPRLGHGLAVRRRPGRHRPAHHRRRHRRRWTPSARSPTTPRASPRCPARSRATGARILTELDAVGNTTKAITKGIAIATAVLAATALFGSFRRDRRELASGAIGERRRLGALQSSFTDQSSNPKTLVGLLIGASVVFLFSGLAINAVAARPRARRLRGAPQFRENPGIMDGHREARVRPGHRHLHPRLAARAGHPGLLAVLAPVAVGFGLGVGPLGAFLAGAIVTGTLMANFLANSGGAWDNAKKYVEDGNHGGKGSEAHEAAVIGDTVGDPFKDTAGPALNPLIKVMNLVSLLIAPAIVSAITALPNGAPVRFGIALVAAAVIVVSVVVSKRRSTSLRSTRRPPRSAHDQGSRNFDAQLLRARMPPSKGVSVLTSRRGRGVTAGRSCSGAAAVLALGLALTDAAAPPTSRRTAGCLGGFDTGGLGGGRSVVVWVGRDRRRVRHLQRAADPGGSEGRAAEVLRYRPAGVRQHRPETPAVGPAEDHRWQAGPGHCGGFLQQRVSVPSVSSARNSAGLDPEPPGLREQGRSPRWSSGSRCGQHLRCSSWDQQQRTGPRVSDLHRMCQQPCTC